MGKLVLGESYNLTQLLFSLLAFSGIILVAKPAALFHPSAIESTLEADVDKSTRFSGVVAAVIAAFLQATVMIVLRKIGVKINSVLFTHYYQVIGIFLVSIWGMKEISVVFEGYQYTGLVFLGLAHAVYQIFFSRAIQLYNAGKVSILLYSQVLFAIMWDLLLHKTLSMWSILGCVVIVGSAVGVILSRETTAEGEGKEALMT